MTQTHSLRRLAVAVSLNELAWIALFGSVLWFDHSVRDYQSQIAVITQDRDSLKRQLDSAPPPQLKPAHELLLNQELVGVRGRLKTVVFVIDRSGSMNRGGRWLVTRNVIKSWLEHLPIERAALVIFNGSVSSFPGEQTYWELTGPAAGRNRSELLDTLDKITPEGNTNTLAALQKAYRYRGVDTILLFSDGEPDSGANAFDKRMAARVHVLCRGHGKSVPVNTVGLGDYLGHRDTGRFLVSIAHETGGTFLGR